MDYLELLARLHAALRPRTYLEIGVEFGKSLRLSRTRSIAVDPDPKLSAAAVIDMPWLKFYRESSDDFFRGHAAEATLEGCPLDLAFIDGFHAFARVVRDLEHVEHWGHAKTIVVVHDTLPENSWQASRAFHDGMWTGDVWRIVPFLQEHRPDLKCWLVDAKPTGVLLVTGLDPTHAGMTELAGELDRTFPPDGLAYQRLADQWLQQAKPCPPEAVLRSLHLPPQSVDHKMRGEGWLDQRDGQATIEQATERHRWIELLQPIQGSHRASLTVTARGFPVLRITVLYTGPGGLRHRNIYLNLSHPGALLHGLDSLWLDFDPRKGSFQLDWEGAQGAEESLTRISLDPLDYWLRETELAPDMAIDVQHLALQQIAWPRPGVHFAPERFPNRPVKAKRTNGKRDAVIFAWWTPANAQAHMVGEYYLGLLRYHHPDSKIFAGVNHGSDPDWIGLLARSGLDIEIVAVDPAIQIRSDVGGFLAALGAFSRCGEAFDLVWFGHTKGASRANFDEFSVFRYQHDRRFWSRRAEIDRFFRDPKIGLFAHRYALHDPSAHVPWYGFRELDSLNRVYHDTYAPLGLWAWETVYVMRHAIVRKFCDAVGEDFFRLDPTFYGGGLWWFEAAFPSIASMQGFEPMIELDTDGEGSSRNDLLLYDDPRQTNRLAMEELQRWREDPFEFEPRVLPRGYASDPIVSLDTPRHDERAGVG